MSCAEATKRRWKARLLLACLCLWGGIAGAEGDWLGFRGPMGSASSDEGSLPTSWSEAENVAWRVDLPGRGVSSPIVTSGRVIVTASSGYRQDRLHVLCFDARDGRRLWERQAWATGRTLCHPKTCMAAPTPTSDGRVVCALYSTGDLLCLDLDGDLLWYRGLAYDYPNASSGIGMASSPLLCGSTLVVQMENQSDSFAAGIELETGVNIWRIERPSKPSWSTPVLLPSTGTDGGSIILESWDRLSAHDPLTGRELWARESPNNCIPSCVVHEGLLLVPSQGLIALRPPRAGPPGASGEPEVVWQSARLRPTTPSPALVGGRVYVLGGAGILTCADAQTGDVRWQLRLKGPHSSTPVAAGGHLYCFSEEGEGQVVRLGDPGEVVGGGSVGQTVLATPAIAGGALYVRTDAHLWKIARTR